MKKALLTLAVFVSTLAIANAQSFMDNTFIDGMVGVNQHFEESNDISAGSNVFFGKWFSPVFATRLGWHGHFGKHFSSQVVRGDFMFNLTNKSSDLAIIPFLSLGGDFHSNKEHNFMIGFGGELAFGLSNQLQFLVDIAFTSDIDPKNTGSIPFFCFPTMPASVGLRYNL